MGAIAGLDAPGDVTGLSIVLAVDARRSGPLFTSSRYSSGTIPTFFVPLIRALHHPSASRAGVFSTISISFPSLNASSSSFSDSGSKS